MLYQLTWRNDASLLVDEIGEQAVFERRQGNRNAAAEDPHMPCVEAEFAGLHDRRSLPDRAADQRADASDQLLHAEGLGEIIVGAGIDALDPFRPGAARVRINTGI